VARYARDRGYLNQERYVHGVDRPHAVTANLLVRADAWRSIGGFLEGIQSGGDSEFAWRLQEVGWRLGYRPDARVTHHHRDTLRDLARLTARYAAGRAWLKRRYPGAFATPPPLRSSARAVAAALRWLLSGRPERARFRAIDALVSLVDALELALPNTIRDPTGPRASAEIVVFTDAFPEISETFIGAELRALTRAGRPVRVEAARRPLRQDLVVAREHAVDFLEDDSAPHKLSALAGLVVRHPLRCAADLVAQRRWRREEPVAPLRVLAPVASRLARRGGRHLHAHFAAGAALNAMRLARLTGRRYSLTAHAYDIYRDPRNLREKLERATFVATGCDYNVSHLRAVAPAARVHEIVMGVEGERFTRRSPYPGGRSVIAVGRLVEKKGFAVLIDAVAALERRAPIERLEILGDGPLREQLRRQVERLGLAAKVRMPGAVAQDAVRAAMEHTDLLAMPCIVASDGDRDSMPVVVKEALALEVPVVASDEVGLPELVRHDWGRLVPPGDPGALADAIAELLARTGEERVGMGRAGRAHVLEHCSVDREAGKLLELIDQGRGPSRPAR
jgi:glycosyltransferase involved in cell wall biosynthesis